MTNTNNTDQDQTQGRKINVKAISMAVLAISAILFVTYNGNEKEVEVADATENLLTGNPNGSKPSSISSINNDSSTADITENVKKFDSLSFTQVLNEQDDIKNNIGDLDRQIDLVNQNLINQDRKVESLISEKLNPINSKLGNMEKNLQNLQDTIVRDKVKRAEEYSSEDGAFRFNDKIKNDKDEKRVNTGNLKSVSSGYVSFNSSVTTDITEGLLSEVSDELSPTTQNQPKQGTKVAGGVSQPQEDAKYYYTTVNADSYVDATFFHGVSCPIGAGVSVGSDGVGAINPAPVIIKITGMFKGANGELNDIGDARIRAKCIGRRTSDDDYGRAEFEVERLTYSNSDGEDFQIDGLGGYTIDTRDEVRGVKGPIDKVLGSNIFAQTMAGAMSAIGLGFSSQQYSQADSGALGTTTQLFTGSVAKDMLGQGIGTMFQQIQQYWSGLMNSEVDRVMLPAGRKVRIVIDEAFVIKEPKSNLKNYSGVNDDLFL
jgi:hypothetical protein